MNKIEDSLRHDLQESLKKHGFILNGKDKLTLPANTKNDTKDIQLSAKNEIINKKKQFIIDNAKLVRKYTINGKDINLKKIKLEIKPVLSKTSDEILFRWWNLIWWSMPYQRPYGRQMRFIIWDTTHNAPFGLVSLQSPILRQAVRDKNLEIPRDRLDYWVNRSMFAQRTGALPPYNYLLGGKMVALSLISNEIKSAYQEKYSNTTTIIAERNIDPELLFITTSSAFGRSSIYNRLKYHDEIVAERLGYTEGYGSFQISDDLYERLLGYLKVTGENVGRSYGNGPSRKIKLIGLACRKLGLADYSYHGIKREYFLFSFIKNLKQVIGEQEDAIAKDYSFNELFDYWKERWMKKRALNTTQWYDFNMDTYITDVINSLNKGAINE
jgi:hypothetical protein